MYPTMKGCSYVSTRLPGILFLILSLSFSTLVYSAVPPAPGNDLCANAVTLTSGTSCVNTSGTVVAATYTATLTDCGGSTPTYDVWYKFVAQTVNPTITLSLAASGSSFNTPRIQLFSGACGGFTSLGCATSTNPGSGSINASGLTIGNTYYIRVYSLNGAAPGSNGTFNICVTDPAPANDNCAGAVTLTSGTTCTNIQGNTVGATLSGSIPAPACGTPVYDVWYTFTAQTTNPTITLSSLGINFTNSRIQLLSGSCASLANVTCSSTTSLAATGLTIGSAYFIRIYSTSAAPSSSGTFNICVTDPAPANDNCAGAVTLISGTTCTNIQGNVVGATLSASIPAPACGTPVYDVWYSFTALATNPTITLSSLGSNFTNSRIQLLSGSCGSLANVSCSSTTSLAATGLTIGATYFVRIYSTSAAPASNGTFNICITDPAPANDNCAGAVTLTSNVTCTNTTGSVNGATLSASIPAPACGTPVYDVWYTFTAQTTNPTITLSSLGSNFINSRIQLLSGSCASLTNVTCSSTTSLAATGLTIGTVYYVRVYSTSAAPTSNGSFNICVDDPAPANDDCAGAVTLTSGTTCTNIQGNVVGATLSASIPAPACGTPVYDVWYTFTALATNPTIALSSLGSNFTNSRIQLLSGSCGSLANVSCSSTTSLAATGLTIGATYFVRIYSTSAAPASNGTFNICITDPAPANDNCAGAVTLTPGATCTNTMGSVNGATLSASIPAPSCGTPVYDVWYTFIAQTTNPTITLSSLGSNFINARIQLLTGSCASLSNVSCSSTTSLAATGLTIGATYYVRVYSTSAAPTSNGSFNICVDDPVPANDDCAGAVTLTSGASCSNIQGNVVDATLSGSIPAPACGTPVYDVWYSFVAQTTNPTITLSSLGSNFTNSRIQLLSGSCGSLSNVSCSSTTSLAATGLTIGSTYFVRIYSTSAAPSSNGTFNICITDPAPANDNCSGAISLTSAPTCSNTAGNVVGATLSASIPAPSCGTPVYDVWYSFVALTTNPTITLSSLGSNFINARIQLLSGSCASLSNVSCSSTTSLAATGLSIGTTYYVRVYSTSAAPSSNGTFNICVADPPPVNDNCSGSITLTSSTTCNNTAGTLYASNSTASVPGSCGNASSADVWYSFTAQTAYPTITLNSVGASFNTASPRIQILSGSCGSWTSIACGTTTSLNTATSPGGAGLTVGATYYVRISTNSATVPSSGTWTFNICITDQAAGRVDYSKSYINVTKGLNGGTVDPGDTLEIRATFVIFSKAADSLAFYDTLYHSKGFRLVPGSISLRTNEGKIYGSAFTDNFDSDPGWRVGSGTDTTIQINLGLNASSSVRGKLRNTSKPSFYGGTCIIMATYRVVVYAGYNTKINYKGGAITYRDTATGLYSKINFNRDSLIVYSSPGLCPNAISALNGVGVESNGSFGVPSTGAPLARNRGTTAYTPTYTYAPFQSASPQGPQDYYYGITNNTSAAYTLLNTWGKGDASSPSHRVFTLWDIIGDHTGAANTAKGNPPCDTTLPVSSTNPCGYMLVINSAYKTDTAFQYTISNICPNTNYEISAWMRNICYKCGCDSNGVGASGGGYIPLSAGDSSGVQPNLAFQVDGTDYYTTGNLRYSGVTPNGSDSTNSWVKRGFTYLSGPSQSSFTLTIRNNAPGGGGNDWALDDINVVTCLPNMSYSPILAPTVCDSNSLVISDTIRSYFNNYTNYKWQRSTNSGSSWSDVTAALGPATPTWNGSAYQYVSSYTVPPSHTSLADSGDLYRVIVATTTPNLANSDCQFTDGVSIITLRVIDCSIPLKMDLLSFNGKLLNDHTHLSWTTSREDEPIHFDIERSIDGISFTKIGTINSSNNPRAEVNQYSFIDPDDFKGKAWYRIDLINSRGRKKYSQIILVTKAQIDFGLGNIINPFSNELVFEVMTTNAAKIDISLIDMYGKIFKNKYYSIYPGVNSLSLKNLEGLPVGMYILQIKNKDVVINNMVLKR